MCLRFVSVGRKMGCIGRVRYFSLLSSLVRSSVCVLAFFYFLFTAIEMPFIGFIFYVKHCETYYKHGGWWVCKVNYLFYAKWGKAIKFHVTIFQWMFPSSSANYLFNGFLKLMIFVNGKKKLWMMLVKFYRKVFFVELSSQTTLLLLHKEISIYVYTKHWIWISLFNINLFT